MPVFFYIDPDFVEDVRLEYTDEILLSYTFFEAKQGLQLPQPLSDQSRVSHNHVCCPYSLSDGVGASAQHTTTDSVNPT